GSAAAGLDRPYPQLAITTPWPGRWGRGRALHVCLCAVRLAAGWPAARSAVAADRDLRHRAGSHRGGDARSSHGGRSPALGASRRSAALVRDQRCDLVGHAIAGRLAGAGRCAAGARYSLLEDALAAWASFAGLRRRPRNGRRARKGVAGSGTAVRGYPDGEESRVAEPGQSQIKTV